MKKILALALLLALTMSAAAGVACAETLDLEAGTPSKITPEEFKVYFSLLMGNSGYNFVWKDSIGTDGIYSVYSGISEDDMMTVNIYAVDDGVVYVEGKGSLVVNFADVDGATKFGEWFGASLGGMAFSFQIGDHGLESLNEDTTSKFSDDLMALVTEISDDIEDENKLIKGFAVCSTVLGYPTGLEAKGTINGSVIGLTMRILVTGADGKLIMK